MNRKNAFFTIFIILFFLIYFVVLTKFGLGNSISNIRYYFLFFLCIIGLCKVLLKKDNKKIYCKELLLTIIIGIIFYVLSFIKAKSVGMSLNIRTYVQIFLIVMPSICAFCIINIYSTKEIIRILKVILLVTIIGYFLEDLHSIGNLLNLDNWIKINLMDSHSSFLESSFCSELFVQLFCFFYYFKDTNLSEKEKKSLNKYTKVSLIFSLISFKRLAIVFCIFIYFFMKNTNLNKKVNKKRYIIISIIFCSLTVLYTHFIKGDIKTSIDIFKFSSGRDYIFSLWQNYNFLSYGYGTSMLVIGRYLEMDLVQIYMELGIIALAIVTLVYFKIANKNNYANIIMIYSFVNLLTASSFPFPASWIISFITIGIISSKKLEDENIKYEKKVLKIKRR